MKKVNYKSDFELIANWVGESDEILPFVLTYSAGGAKYTASYNGRTWRNCEKVDDKKIRVIFDNHNLGVGKLYCKFTFWIDNPSYPDGKQTIESYVETNIQLVNASSDDVLNDVQLELMPNYMRGYSAYEIAVKEGFEGTEAEWLDSLKATNIAFVEDDTNGACIVIEGRKFKLGEEIVEGEE